MDHNYRYTGVNQALPRLLDALFSDGEEVGSRAGRTMELTHVGITLTDPTKREIILPSRKASIAAQIAETMWVISGRDDMEFLSHYLPRAMDFSDDGKTWRAGYGKRLRSWPKRDGSDDVIDQLAYVVDLLKRDATSRQAVMTIWDPYIDTNPGKDIPCNDWITFSSRLGRLDMHVGLRSNDVIWGWSGINAFEWSTILEVVAGLLGVKVGSLHFSTTSFHVYEHHWKKAATIQDDEYSDMRAGLEDSPRFDIGNDRSLENFDGLCQGWFQIEEFIRTGSRDPQEITRLIQEFPEPMLQSWLRVIRWWWTGRREHLQPLLGTRLAEATLVSVQPKPKVVEAPEKAVSAPHRDYSTVRPSRFIETAIALHNEKHAAYGDSWKRRGEMLGIMANVARKIDRLGGSSTADESSTDTAMDLMIYLAKYRDWFNNSTVSLPDTANNILKRVDAELAINGSADIYAEHREATEDFLRETFDKLEVLVTNQKPRHEVVDAMLYDAYRLARHLWVRDQLLAPKHDGESYRGADVD